MSSVLRYQARPTVAEEGRTGKQPRPATATKDTRHPLFALLRFRRALGVDADSLVLRRCCDRRLEQQRNKPLPKQPGPPIHRSTPTHTHTYLHIAAARMATTTTTTSRGLGLLRLWALLHLPLLVTALPPGFVKEFVAKNPATTGRWVSAVWCGEMFFVRVSRWDVLVSFLFARSV